MKCDLAAALLLLGALFACGCGGGGGRGSSAPLAVPAVTVDWPTRTRDLTGPTSALSVKVVLATQGVSQPKSIEIDGDRNPTLAAHNETYSAAGKIATGSYMLTATFYSQSSLGGVVTATATAQVGVSSSGTLTNPNGTTLGAITFISNVHQVAVASNQSVTASNSVQINAAAYDSSDNVIALTPGSFTFAITSGGSFGTITPDGILTGVAVGTLDVTATVDGVTSPAASVQVNPVTAQPSVSVDWPLRTRNVEAPSSALSVKMILHSPGGANPDVEIDGNRDSTLAAHTETYTYPGQAATGAYTLYATFYAAPSLGGVVTASATASVALNSQGVLTNPDGSQLGQINFTGLIKSVVVTSNQSVAVGSSTQLTASPLDVNGNLIAVSPGSFQWVLTSGSSFATITPDGIITGSNQGSVTVTATVDGVTSPSATVQVATTLDFANPGFETPQIAANSWDAPPPAGTSWTWTYSQGQNSCGIENGASSWGSTAHSGTQFAFAQAGSSISQTITGLQVGQIYQVTFWVASRDGDVGANFPCPLTVTANGSTIVNTFTPPGDFNWYQYTSSAFTASSTSYTFVFQTTSPGYDSTDLLDDIHLVAGQ